MGGGSRFLAILLPLKLKDHAELESKSNECTQKLKTKKEDPASVISEKDKNGKVTKFCWKTYKVTGASSSACNICSAIFSEESGLKSGSKCTFCEIGTLAPS